MYRALLVLVMVAAPASAQTVAPAPAPAAPSAVVLSPRFTALRGQNQQQQQLDDAQCQNKATQLTGFVLGSTPPASTAQQGLTGNRLRGAALGAATGAVVGSAGSGAAAGAVAGGTANRAGRRQADRTDAQAQAEWQQQQQAWNQQYTTCMQARGYSVP